MTATPELRIRLRKLVSEVIPSGGTEADTRFMDAELDAVLGEVTNIWAAAAELWQMKAALLIDERGTVDSQSMGPQSVQYINLSTYIDNALKMVDRYKALSKSNSPGAIMLNVELPEVL